MALKTFVKVSTVNNLSDARYCAGMEVNLIGFNLEKDTPGYISPENYKELTEWLSGVSYVAEFEHYGSSEIKEALALYSPDYLQVNNENLLKDLIELDLPIILKINLDDTPHPVPHPEVTYLLVTGNDEELTPEHIAAIKALSSDFNILIGTGITDGNVAALLDKTGVHGIALQGGDELRPGYKDYDELADILEALEVEEEF